MREGLYRLAYPPTKRNSPGVVKKVYPTIDMIINDRLSSRFTANICRSAIASNYDKVYAAMFMQL